MEAKRFSSAPSVLKAAFLGGAYETTIGRIHHIAMAMDRRFELVAGCFSRSEEANHAGGRLYGLPEHRVHSSLEALLAAEKPHIDVVIILTPTNQHTPQVIRCIEAGIPVICEKSLAVSSEEARQIDAILQRHHGYLAVIQNYSGYPMLRELKHRVENGQLGHLQQILLEMPQEGFSRLNIQGKPNLPQSWRLHDNTIPTLSLDLGVHLHNLAAFISGQRPQQVMAATRTYGNFGHIADTVSCTAHYSNNLLCQMWYTKTALGQRNGLSLRLYGEQGSAEWHQDNAEQLLMTDKYGRRLMLDAGSPDTQVGSNGRYIRFRPGHPNGFIEAFANHYADIADSLHNYRKGKNSENPFIFDIQHSIAALEFLEAVALSSKQNQWINL